MKQTLSAILLLALPTLLLAQTPQTTPILLNYTAWPIAPASMIISYNQATPPPYISVFNLSGAQIGDLRAQSTFTGTLNGINVTATHFSDPVYNNIISIGANSITIQISSLLSSMKANDAVTLTLISNNIAMSYTFTYNTATAALAQLSPDDLTAYEKNILRVRYIKRDVGYKYRYMKPSGDETANKGLAHILGIKRVVNLKPDELGELNDHLLDNYTIHIFLDQYGNNLFGSTPTGIQQKYHYMLHIIVPKEVAPKLHYSISVSSGSLSDAGTSYNSDIAPPKPATTIQPQVPDHSNGSASPAVPDVWLFNYNLFPTSDDLTYTISLKADGYDAVNFSKTYTIKKTNYYRGSFDVGVFKTWLSNPSFSMVNAPNPVKAGDQALKVTDNGPNVTATFMYTFYLSFWNALIPSDNNGLRHNYWGRTFLDDDGGFIRKIYPAIGIGLNGNVLNNWFIGLNCQPMVGFGIFAGANIRKINYFDAPGGQNLNALSQDQFNYYSNTRTRTDWAIGIIIDTSIFTKIANSISASAK